MLTSSLVLIIILTMADLFPFKLVLAKHANMSDLVRHASIRARSDRVFKATASTDRLNYIHNDDKTEYAYVDAPQPIGHDVTISAPHMHIYACNVLDEFMTMMIDQNNHQHPSTVNVLDVGSGSGYLMAAFYRLLHDGWGVRTGKIHGVEVVEALVNTSLSNLQTDLESKLTEGGFEFQVFHKSAYDINPTTMTTTYDFIHVGAACKGQVPESLKAQLKPKGWIVLPLDDQMQVYEKTSSGEVKLIKADLPVRYVPLVR